MTKNVTSVLLKGRNALLWTFLELMVTISSSVLKLPVVSEALSDWDLVVTVEHTPLGFTVTVTHTQNM